MIPLVFILVVISGITRQMVMIQPQQHLGYQMMDQQTEVVNHLLVIVGQRFLAIHNLAPTQVVEMLLMARLFIQVFGWDGL